MKSIVVIFMICVISSFSHAMDYFKKEMAKKILHNALEEAKKDPFVQSMQEAIKFISEKPELEESNQNDLFDFSTLNVKKIE